MILCQGDARHIPLADETVQCCVTSPPYWGLRDYNLGNWVGGDAACRHKIQSRFDYPISGKQASNAGSAGQYKTSICATCGAVHHDPGIGLEASLEEYIANLVAVFREVWRVLRPDGTLWLNMGDSFCSNGKGGRDTELRSRGKRLPRGSSRWGGGNNEIPGLKGKDLIGLPWHVAFALQADGWWLRSDIIWAKPNPMPESVTDRPTGSHEHVFLLTKRPRYYYDAEAIAEPCKSSPSDIRKMLESLPRIGGKHKELVDSLSKASASTNIGQKRSVGDPTGRNRRDVWFIATQVYKGAHFATFPEKLVEPCILAGTSPKACDVCGAPWERVVNRPRVPQKAERPKRYHVGDGDVSGGPGNLNGDEYRAWMEAAPAIETWRPTCDHNDDSGSCLVLDPFAGSGTTGAVARRLGRRFVGIDLKWAYLKLAEERIDAVPIGMAI